MDKRKAAKAFLVEKGMMTPDAAGFYIKFMNKDYEVNPIDLVDLLPEFTDFVENMILKVVKMQDEDSHWYWIPENEVQDFRNLLQIIDEGNEQGADTERYEDEFYNRFNQYRTGGDPSCVPLCFEGVKVQFL